ncbi:MAG: hypothetical protein ACE5OZ_01590 [Candidatus Heimdallarchaeota archaeon]
MGFNMSGEKLDSITAEVVGNALQSITEQMGIALVRSAYSTTSKSEKIVQVQSLLKKGKRCKKG